MLELNIFNLYLEYGFDSHNQQTGKKFTIKYKVIPLNFLKFYNFVQDVLNYIFIFNIFSGLIKVKK